MVVNKTKIEGLYLIDLVQKNDDRGYFTRVFANDELINNGIKFNIVHINRSLTKQKGTIRGMHFQKKPKEEDKIVQCFSGSIFDVVVDLRKNSETYKQWMGIVLTADDKKQVLIPKGCAHGFQTLERNTVVEYFVSERYSPENEDGIRWNDPVFNIKWPIANVIVSKKDKNWPGFNR